MTRVAEAHYLHDYVVRIRMTDGSYGDLDLRDELHGEMFEPLRDVALFRRVRVDPELGTIVWPNGADLAPEYLADLLHAAR